MAIADDFLIDYTDKRIRYIGGFTNGLPDSIYTSNEWYTFLQDTFDELTQLDDTIPVKADTPTEYQIINGWFIDDVSTQSLYGGSLKTANLSQVIFSRRCSRTSRKRFVLPLK